MGELHLQPFFTFYGGKYRAARHYPRPARTQIIEPFAGSAGYSVNHSSAEVWLNDIDPVITGTWTYLINVSEKDILNLPDLNHDQTVDDLKVPQEARWLIGWWINKGSTYPARRASTFMLQYPEGGPYWGDKVRQRIASQLPAIRHWKITTDSYENLPDTDACWFIDPPYIKTGQCYRNGSQNIDYKFLSTWIHSRSGQVMACEADSADWLPFSPLVPINGSEGRQKQSRANMEFIYEKRST